MAEELDHSGYVVDDDVISVAMQTLDLVPTDEGIEHFKVLIQCMRLYEERDLKYGSAWKRLGALNNLTRMSTKIERLLAMFWHKPVMNGLVEVDLDDAYDGINYHVFFIRQARKGNWTKG